MSELNGDVTVACPVTCEPIATSLRAAGSMRKDDDRELLRIVRIKNSHVQVFVPFRVMEDEVFNLGDRVRTGLQLVTARVRRGRNGSSRWGISRRMQGRAWRGFSFSGHFSSGKTGAARRTSDEIGRSEA